jgi:hypothetical protein
MAKSPQIRAFLHVRKAQLAALYCNIVTLETESTGLIWRAIRESVG